VLWISGAFDEARVWEAMERALPRIEGLTIALPPPNPDGAEGAGKLHA
jgi:hypothetical protein